MPERQTIAAATLTVLLAFRMLACGSSNSNRVLESMTITPARADAQTSPTGQVQFRATGQFGASAIAGVIVIDSRTRLEFDEPHASIRNASNTVRVAAAIACRPGMKAPCQH